MGYKGRDQRLDTPTFISSLTHVKIRAEESNSKRNNKIHVLASSLQLGTSGFAEFSKFGKRVTGFTEFTESDQGISIDFTPKSSIKKKSRNISFDSQKFF